MMKLKCVVRSAALNDLESLTALLQELFEIESDFSPDSARQLSGLKLLLKKDDAVILVAESGGEVVGMCTLQTLISTAEGGPVGLLEDMLVKSYARRQGIGKTLLLAAEKWAARRGLSRLQLLTENDNEAALRFYFRCGWQRTGLICERKMLH